MIGFGVESRTQWSANAITTAISPRLSWTQRLPFGTSAHALRLNAAFAPGFEPFTRRWSMSADASFRSEIVLRTDGGREWMVVPRVSANYLNDQLLLMATLGIEPLGRR